MTEQILALDILDLLNAGSLVELHEAIHEAHPAEIAEGMASFEDDDVWRFFAAIPHRKAAEIFSHMDLERQVDLAGEANRYAMARMLEDLPHDDRADLVQNLDPKVAERILPLVARADREDIRKLTSYEDGTAGSLMSSDYATLRPEMSAAQALEQIRVQAPTRETIYYIYVVDENHRLIGFVSLKDLILARPSQMIRELMHEDIITADVNEDQEPVARNIQKYDLLAIPVVDSNRRLVGIITYDDAIDVIRQEQQEDLEKLMAIGGEHKTGEYMRTTALGHFRNRVPWVVILSIMGLVSGFIVQSFEGMLLQFAILAAFMPMLADTGGNTGSQSATLVVRALALGELRTRDVLRVLLKEFCTSVLLAVVLAGVAFGRVMFFGSASTMPEGYSLAWIGMAISIALGLQVVSSTLIGAILPLVAAKVKLDPALVASPALTTIVDITGLLLFFTTVKLLLGF